MDEENRNRDKVLRALKKIHNIEPIKKLRLDLSSFIIANKGEHFRYLYAWRINNVFNNIFLCSLRNSYETEGMNNYYFFQKDHVAGRYFSLLIESKIELPDLIIRPSSLTDMVSNLFLDFDIKLSNRQKFNSNYILESNASKSDCEKFLTSDLTSLIEQQKNFYLEIKDSRIFLKHEQEMQMQNSLDLLEIGILIDEKIKHAA